jgi:fermentation-respiration switch protein FrsA (DUF1100 family)
MLCDSLRRPYAPGGEPSLHPAAQDCGTMARGDRFFFYPTRTVYDRPEEQGLAYEPVAFEAGDGVGLHGWFLPAEGQAVGTLVHCHGNAGNITGHYQFVAFLLQRGWNVLCFDYRGFGESAGRPSREGVVADTHAAVDYAKRRDDVDSDWLVLFGQSIGGTVAIVAAAERNDLAAVAVEGAFSSYRAEAGHVCRHTWWLWGVSAIVPQVFIAAGCDAIDYVGRIGAIPKLFICATRDGIVDHRQTVALHDAATEPKELWVVDDGGHTGGLVVDEADPDGPAAERRDRFCEFLRTAVQGKRS